MQSREILLIDEAEDKTNKKKDFRQRGNPDRQTNININSLMPGVH